MSPSATDEQILAQLLDAGVIDPDDLPAPRPPAPECLALLVRQGRVTHAQIEACRTPAGRLGALGPYALQEELGRGGMGVVYRATDGRLQRDVAVKTLVAGEHASPELIARFVREAQAAAKLGSHPHIVPVLDVGQEGTRHYIVMEFVEGDSLEHLIDEGAIPVRHAARYASKVARAVQHAHDNGVYHRDLKPANVMVGGDHEPRLTDFGLARFTGADHDRLTQSGALVGTPHYMAPEQVQGDYDAVDHRTDVYGVGAILYEMLTDAPPFGGGGTPDIIRKVVLDPPRAPRRANPGVPRDLETICLKALEKPKERRYQSAGDLADDLERWLRGEPIAASPISGVSRMVRWAKRKPFAAATLLLAAAACLLGGAFAWTLWAAAAAWRSQVDDALTDLRYEKYEEALGKLEALLKERPGDPELQRRLQNARDGLRRAKAARETEIRAGVEEGLRARYLQAAEGHLTRLRELAAEARAHRRDMLAAQEELWRLNDGGEPAEGDVAGAHRAAQQARDAAAERFYAAIYRRLEPEFGAFEAAARSAQQLGAPRASALLFEGLRDRLRLTREYGDVNGALTFVERMRASLPERPEFRMSRQGAIRVATEPAGAEIWAAPVTTQADGRRVAGEFARAGTAGPDPVALPAGVHLVELRTPGFAPARWPVWVSDDETVGDGRPVRLLTPQQIGAGFKYVPRGRTFLGVPTGSRERWYHAPAEVEGFLIGEFEVTLREYGAFVLSQAQAGKPAEALVPMQGYPEEYRPLLLRRNGDTWRLDLVPSLADAPAMGVSRPQAMLYAAWRSARDGRAYRLPTEREWVRAARGGDWRGYPWGFQINPRRAVYNGAFEGGVRPPARPGIAAEDVSPFGVRDLGGSVQEWVSSLYAAGEASAQARGGGWATPPSGCLLTVRHRVNDDAITMDFGFRLVADLPAR